MYIIQALFSCKEQDHIKVLFCGEGFFACILGKYRSPGEPSSTWKSGMVFWISQPRLIFPLCISTTDISTTVAVGLPLVYLLPHGCLQITFVLFTPPSLSVGVLLRHSERVPEWVGLSLANIECPWAVSG